MIILCCTQEKFKYRKAQIFVRRWHYPSWHWELHGVFTTSSGRLSISLLVLRRTHVVRRHYFKTSPWCLPVIFATFLIRFLLQLLFQYWINETGIIFYQLLIYLKCLTLFNCFFPLTFPLTMASSKKFFFMISTPLYSRIFATMDCS